MKRRYPGIKPFDYDDAPVFRGRQRETREVLNLVLTQKMLVLFARSGIGKTSLLNAGVAPKLSRYDVCPVFIQLNVTGDPVKLFQAQYQRVFDAFYQNAPGSGVTFQEAETLWDTVHQNPLVRDNTTWVPVLIFDQFEEFFRTYPAGERAVFLKQLGEILSDSVPYERLRANREAVATIETEPLTVRVVFSIRADYLNLMQEVSTYAPFVMRVRYELKPFDRAKATEAIVGPGELPNELVEDLDTGRREYRYGTGIITFPDAVISNILKGLEETPLASGTSEVVADALDGLANEGVSHRSIDPQIDTFQLQLLCSYLEDRYIRDVESGKTAADTPVAVKTEDYQADKTDTDGIRGIIKRNEDYFRKTVVGVINEESRAELEKRKLNWSWLTWLYGGWYLYRHRPDVVDALKSTLSNGNRIWQVKDRLALSDTIRTGFLNRAILREENRDGADYYRISHDRIALALQKEKVRVEQQRKEQRYWLLLAMAAFAILGLLGAVAYLWFGGKADEKKEKKASISQPSTDSTRADRPPLSFTTTTTETQLVLGNDTIRINTAAQDTIRVSVRDTVVTIGKGITSVTIRDTIRVTIRDTTRLTGSDTIRELSGPDGKVPALQVAISQLNGNKISRYQKAYADAIGLMNVQLFRQAVTILPTVQELTNDFPTVGLSRATPDQLREVDNLKRKITTARNIALTMQPVQKLVEKAECLEQSFRIACANKLYTQAQRMNKKPGAYRYPEKLLQEKINATSDAVAEGIYAGLNDRKLKTSYTWLDTTSLKAIYDDKNCRCTDPRRIRP